MLADYSFVYRYCATVNTKVRPAVDGEDCRRVYVTLFWLYYISLLFIIITITFSYILTTEITAPVSASAQSDAGCRYYIGPYRLSISSKQLQNIENSKIFN